MRLNLQSDYSLRLLMHLAANPDRLVTIAEVASRFRISQNHLMKVAHLLGREGLIETLRGRAGGLRLALAPDRIRVGDVVRRMEGDIRIVECFSSESGCLISGACRLKGALHEALDAFLNVLDRYTLADLTKSPRLRALLHAEAA
ncbi:MAG TPA: Rrf2 family transcriptional regulator [Hyphomonadaceae bacterium]|nr:Rrf2 family transcriptional regulator [Hyphomonadaceae bacterium]